MSRTVSADTMNCLNFNFVLTKLDILRAPLTVVHMKRNNVVAHTVFESIRHQLVGGREGGQNFTIFRPLVMSLFQPSNFTSNLKAPVGEVAVKVDVNLQIYAHFCTLLSTTTILSWLKTNHLHRTIEEIGHNCFSSSCSAVPAATYPLRTVWRHGPRVIADDSLALVA